jgi:hypothetical protein
MNESIECWHFSAADRRLGYGDGRLIEVGVVHEVNITPKCCEAGLHGSIRAIDALEYAAGTVVSCVLISGQIDQQQDKLCGQRREYLAVADVTEELRSFARWCALQVIHLWDAPAIVRQYLETGDESIRVAARTAASAAARTAARAAAMNAAWAAAMDATWAAARDAARATARDAAWAAAWAAARDAAMDAQNAELDSRLRKVLNLIEREE